ncbi:hypothetical protein [Thermococcus sp.]|uniref:hypothetical protein n=1 Tax=Thermococcus sp. TaxID=35749 RepID=UPI0025FD5DDC|nr:hypothetical protein [Thermococcus sp.]
MYLDEIISEKERAIEKRRMFPRDEYDVIKNIREEEELQKLYRDRAEYYYRKFFP